MIEAGRHCRQVVVRIVTLLYLAARRLRIAHQCTVHVGTDLFKVTTRILQSTNITTSVYHNHSLRVYNDYETSTDDLLLLLPHY